MLASAFTLSPFQSEDAHKGWLMSCARRVATCLLVGVFLLGSTAQPADAGLWDVVKEWYVSFQLGEVDEANIPQVPVEYVGEVSLLLKNQVELAFEEDTPGIGTLRWMGFSPEGTLLITDRTVAQALEFRRTDGKYVYVRSFGRQGNGPGEYASSVNMAVSPQGQAYLLDLDFGQILRYDRQGPYLDKMRSFNTSRLLTGLNGEVFLLKTNRMKIMEVQRLDPETWELLYRTPVSTDKQRFISYRMATFAHLCYDSARHRLYYLGPNDYLVKEIDAETGAILRQFGRPPEGFMPLPKYYHSLGRGSREDMAELEMTVVNSMILVQDRYLWISHKIGRLGPIRWVLYDLTASARIDAYGFNSSAIERLKSFSNITPWKSVTAWQGRLYMWMPPPEDVAEKSNGIVEIYELSFSASS
ncbi:MAG: 6-bladed beta-propeller [Gemmatimonadetes bacterium]|nr:6-bladed beta-propeller [Gemmatimonadota bacterium]